MSENKSLTLATANDQVLFCYPIREDAVANNFSATPIETTPALQALRPSVQSHHAQTFIAHIAEPLQARFYKGLNADTVKTHLIAQEIPVNEPIGFQPTDGGFANFNNDGKSTTLKASDAPAVAYDEYNDSIGDVHQSLRAGTKQSTGVLSQTVVRRLTPIECERLQGFPDNWTAQRIDKTGQTVEQKDSARYKQMGNAVAVPCVEWLLGRIIHALQPE